MMKTISILFVTIISLMLSGCSPKLTQSFIDKYDTPKLTNECPDFSGVYIGKGQVAYVFYNDEVKLSGGKKADIEEYKILINQKSQQVTVSIYKNSVLFESYKYKDIFADVNKYEGRFLRKSGCWKNAYIGRSFYISNRPEWGGGSRGYYESKLEQQSNSDLKYTLYFLSKWHGPFGNSEEYEPYTKTFILKRIK